MISIDWKTATRKLIEQHNELGGSLVELEYAEHNPDLVDWVEPLGDQMVVMGPQISARRVRSWLYEHRGEDWRQWRKGMVLWSLFDPNQGATYVGLGVTNGEATDGIDGDESGDRQPDGTSGGGPAAGGVADDEGRIPEAAVESAEGDQGEEPGGGSGLEGGHGSSGSEESESSGWSSSEDG